MGRIIAGEFGAGALGEPAPKPGAGLVSVCGRAGEEQPQSPRSAYPAKSGRGPRRAALRDDTLLLGSGSGWVSYCGWVGEEQPQIPRSACPAKSRRGPRRAALRDDTLLLGSGSGGWTCARGEQGRIREGVAALGIGSRFGSQGGARLSADLPWAIFAPSLRDSREIVRFGFPHAEARG